MEFGLPWPGVAAAAEAEPAGVTAFVTGEFADHDPYVGLTEMVHGTTRARCGTGIAYAFARTPYAHATALRQLARGAEGRLFAGLGTGAYRINRDWFSVPADRPVARMGEAVRALRAYLHAENGERIVFNGEFYNIDALIQAPVLGKLDIPILVGAFNRLMIREAARVADGLIGHGLFTTRWWDEVVRPNSGDGLEYGWVITAIDDDDPDRAVRDARRMVGFYLTVKTYDPYVEFHGWQEPVAQIRAAFAKGDMDTVADAVTEEMLEAVTVCGTTKQAQELLESRGDGLPRDVAFFSPPSFLVGFKRREAYSRASLRLIADVTAAGGH
jgi:alkanesulfonate monooxygenase SsuD/methylene tetrahydromethanopterin reductase-like flavin-dependent oxidoreductase (luciferase family)